MQLIIKQTIAACLAATAAFLANAAETRAEVVKKIPVPEDNGGEIAPNAFEPFPAGTISPRGWLKRQLDLQTEGLQGRLYETSEFLTPDNGWLKPECEGWEEQAYWLRTFVKLAILTGNERMLKVSSEWINGIIATADSDGWFGPRGLRNHTRFKDQGICHDIWPHMVMTEALMTWHDYRNDRRILTLMAGFARWCNKVPYDIFLLADAKGGNWHYAVQKDRACDIVPSLFRLYGMTGDKAFLEFSDRCFRYRSRAGKKTTYLDSHNVNFAERFAYETVYSRRSRNPSHRASADYWFDLNALCWGGEMPRWAFASDECARVGCFDARYATETCTWGELTRSFQLLGALSGEPKWGDRAEDVVFNNYPVAFTPDWKKVHYLTAPNQVSLDAATDHNYQKPPPRLAYSAKLYRCCRHNAGLTLPLFTEKLTQRTAKGDLVLWAYAPHSGKDGNVAWTLDGGYPFRERLTLILDNLGGRAVYLRVPGWAKGFEVRRGQEIVADTDEAGVWLKLNGPWPVKDKLEIAMKAVCAFTPHVRSHSVTVERGPLSYSLAIRVKCREVPEPKFAPDKNGVLESHFPEAADKLSGALLTEVLPKSDWNYALDIARPLEYRERGWSDDCFAAETVPCEIVAYGRKVPEWNAQDAQPAELQESPVRTSEPEEKLTFIPMGAARCRLTVLPVVGHVEMQSYKWSRVPEKTVRANRPKIISQ